MLDNNIIFKNKEKKYFKNYNLSLFSNGFKFFEPNDPEKA